MNELTETLSAAVNTDISIITALVTMGTALLYGLMIAFTYMKTQKDYCSQSFVITLTMLPVILSVIILFVGSNVARAFSLAGTLSIIRFRSAPGDPKDIGYIFFDIAAGLAAGVGMYWYGALFVVVLCAFMAVLSAVNFAKSNNTHRMLKVLVPEDLNFTELFNDILKQYTKNYYQIRVKTTDLGSVYEVQYKVNILPDMDEKEFMDRIRERNGNLTVMLCAAESEHS